MILAVGLLLCLTPGAALAEVPDVPKTIPKPFAVLPFENRSGVGGLDWMRAAVPFVVGEKVEGHSGLRPVYGPLVVPEGRKAAPADAVAVAHFARQSGARFVFGGWFKRPSWELQLGISLWRMDGKKVSKVGEVTSRGDFKDAHHLMARAIAELCAKAGIPVPPKDLPAIHAVPSDDFYAFTVFGRGLEAFAGTGGKKDLERAGKNLKRAIFIDPKLVQGQRVLAEFYRREGKMAKARARLEYALKIEPDDYRSLIAAAELERLRGQVESSKKLYEKALSLRPWDLEARFRLARVLWESGEADSAFLQLERVVDHRPDDIRARRILVMIHASRGDGADLVRELEAVVELDPDDETTRLDLAAAYSSVGREEAAIEAYKAVVKRNPKHLQALKFLGDLYKKREKLRFAIKYYGLMLEAQPDDPRSYFLLGAAYVEAGNDRQAKKIYRRAQRFKKYLPEVHNNLGAIAYREGKHEESTWYLKRAVASRPKKVRYRYNFALSLSAARRADEALVQVDKALELDSEHPELHYLRGVVLLRSGEAGRAREEFRRTLALLPDHDGARHNLALLDEMKRRAEEGEVVLE